MCDHLKFCRFLPFKTRQFDERHSEFMLPSCWVSRFFDNKVSESHNRNWKGKQTKNCFQIKQVFHLIFKTYTKEKKCCKRSVLFNYLDLIFVFMNCICLIWIWSVYKNGVLDFFLKKCPLHCRLINCFITVCSSLCVHRSICPLTLRLLAPSRASNGCVMVLKVNRSWRWVEIHCRRTNYK